MEKLEKQQSTIQGMEVVGNFQFWQCLCRPPPRFSSLPLISLLISLPLAPILVLTIIFCATPKKESHSNQMKEKNEEIKAMRSKVGVLGPPHLLLPPSFFLLLAYTDPLFFSLPPNNCPDSSFFSPLLSFHAHPPLPVSLHIPPR